MNVQELSFEVRTGDFFFTIDLGFVNRRLCLSCLPPLLQTEYSCRQKPGSDPITILANDRMLINMLLDFCQANSVPTLLKATEMSQESGQTGIMFVSNAKLSARKSLRKGLSASHCVELDLRTNKPVSVTYHTQHMVSTTGAERLEQGGRQSIVGLLHEKQERFEIEPLVIGTPLFEHHRNPPVHPGTMFNRTIWSYGEILPEDIEEFSKLEGVKIESLEEWMNVMRDLPEKKIKEALAKLLNDPTQNDWSGELNDHFSGHVTVAGRRRCAAFLLKGPTKFNEMTLAMCGKNADQIHRLVDSNADISIVQHCHTIGSYVRRTLRDATMQPGARLNGVARKYCFIDGKTTYRILRAYDLL